MRHWLSQVYRGLMADLGTFQHLRWNETIPLKVTGVTAVGSETQQMMPQVGNVFIEGQS